MEGEPFVCDARSSEGEGEDSDDGPGEQQVQTEDAMDEPGQS
jgi:hypothetical protein